MEYGWAKELIFFGRRLSTCMDQAIVIDHHQVL
jgi:hypothetical protein